MAMALLDEEEDEDADEVALALDDAGAEVDEEEL